MTNAAPMKSEIGFYVLFFYVLFFYVLFSKWQKDGIISRFLFNGYKNTYNSGSFVYWLQYFL